MIKVVKCPVCSTRVVLKADVKCPRCQKSISESESFYASNAPDFSLVLLYEQTERPKIADTPVRSADASSGEFVYKIPPRQIPARFKEKTVMSYLLPRSVSEKLALFVGYGVGGIFFVLCGLYGISAFVGKPQDPRLGMISLFSIGAYFIAMARRRD